MRAALSDSWSREAGQKASAPSLLESLFTGAPTFWKKVLDIALVLSHVDFDWEAIVEDYDGYGLQRCMSSLEAISKHLTMRDLNGLVWIMKSLEHSQM